MLAKLRLDQTNEYELAIVVNKLAHMLVGFAYGRTHLFSIGSEQGDVEKWDDFVIMHLTNDYEYIQAKRQNLPFCTSRPLRGNKTRGDDIGNPQELSELDESIKSLGACFNGVGPIDISRQRKFTFIVPSLLVEIKKSITLNDLYSFQLQITPSTSAPGLQALTAAAPKFADIVTWLKSWCGFTDEAHIIQALLKLKIEQVGNEVTLKNDTLNALSTCFSQSDEVLEKIASYVKSNTSFASAITPRPLLNLLQSFLLPSVPIWTQFRKNGATWEISGTHGRAISETDIEHASTIVPALWNTPSTSVVKYHSTDNEEGMLPAALVRLVLHLKPASVAHINNYSSWTLVTKRLVGGTLGVSSDDFEGVSVMDDNSYYASSEARVLSLLSDHDDEADKLSDEMHTKTWELTCNAIYNKISQMDRTALRGAMEKRWNSWKTALDMDVPKQKQLCKSMLHPNAEGREIQAELRLGPKTVPLVADGFYLLLVVAVCFNDEPNTWDTIDGQLSINAKALGYWSGPAEDRRKVRKLDEDLPSLLGKEPSKILVLSRVECSTSDIDNSSLADGNSIASSIASAYKPTLVVTNSRKLRMLINTGDIPHIRAFLQTEFDKGVKAKSLES